MIHRALLGSIERFLGILIEHHARRVPGLARAGAGARAADRRPPRRLREPRRATSCARAGVRAEVDDRSESVGRKIRDAELAKVPYMLVVGDKEEERGGRLGAPPRRGRPRPNAAGGRLPIESRVSPVEAAARRYTRRE